MDFADRISAHSKRVDELRAHLTNEEATKTSLIMPFFAMLGYDAFDPRVVVPEYTADIGTKKGEKVDYAIKRGDEIIMLVEAKCAGDPLDEGKAAQLRRYFNVTTSAKIAILTDGVVYKFFTDLERSNIMDDKPYMIFDFRNYEGALVDEVKKLCSDCFDIEKALCAAQDLKYLRQIKKLISEELKNPSDEFVKYFVRQVHEGGRALPTLVEDFRERVKVGFQHHINDVINARLQGAIQANSFETAETPLVEKATGENMGKPDETACVKDRIVTTEEEIEGYHIVKAILRETVDPARIIMRDTLSYCGILLDDNNRKPICRLHFNSAIIKYIETIDAEKKGIKHKIEDLNDIYQYADLLKQTVTMYDQSAGDA